MHFGSAAVWSFIAVLLLGIATTDRATAASDSTLEQMCSEGIVLAMAGRSAAAESVFVSLLSRSPDNARAFNNLGNLYVWRGKPEIALEFYGAAIEADTADPGIRLNGATALMLAGEEEAAQLQAEEVVRRAGGIHHAASLLGLVYEGSSKKPSKAADRIRLRREQALTLLRAAARSMPPDSIDHVTPRGAGKRVPAWRRTEPQSDEIKDGMVIVYWKR